MIQHFDIKIFGRVQGVGFRYDAKQRADKLGLTGLARNESNYFYIEVEGELAKLKKFIDWCHRGPLWSKVQQVEVNLGEIKNYTHFTIEHSSELM